MDHNLEQAELFLKLLTGEENPCVTFQVYWDPKNQPIPPGLAKHFTGYLNDNLKYFEDVQSKYCGIYVGLNVTDGIGRENSNILGYRSVFADFDGVTEPLWPLTPTMVTKRDDTHGHAYWLVTDLDDPDTFSKLQKTIAICCNTDHQVTDPARVVRLPGYNHYKNPKVPSQYSVVQHNSVKYTVEELISSFTLNATDDAELHQWLDKRSGLLTGTGYIESIRYNDSFSKWLKIAPQAILGSGSHTLIAVASWAHDHGIPVDTTKRILWEEYNPRCIPPWHDIERGNFNDIVTRAYKYATSASGCKTTVGLFGALPALPEPTGGWLENSKINAPVIASIPSSWETSQEPLNTINPDYLTHRISNQEASILLAQLTVKSAHYDLALAFDGIKYNGGDMIRCDKIFYLYHEGSYSIVSDDVVKSNIQRLYSSFKPTDTLIRGIYSIFCDLVNLNSIQSGNYLNNSNRRTEDIVIYKNGLVDYSASNPIIEPHDRCYFCFNALDYNYDTNAKCPNWELFLDSIWSHDSDLKLSLQEFMGYILTSDTSLHKFLLLLGKSRGGKGVITQIIRSLVGKSNCAAPPLQSMTKDTTLHAMSTSSVGLIPDAHTVSFNLRDSVLSNFKSITGEDPLTYKVMWKGAQTSSFKIRFVMSSNNMPEFTDSSAALANRMIVLPITKSFVGKEDTKLADKLKEEIEGINQWALAGLLRLRITNKFTQSRSSELEKEEIKEEMFPLSGFIYSMCSLHVNAYATTECLYSAYLLWCNLNAGISKPLREIQFSRCLKNSELDVNSTRRYEKPDKYNVQKRVNGFTGIELTSDITERLLNNNIVRFPPVS